jgi:L-amino acid N-acyltransferase YncA
MIRAATTNDIAALAQVYVTCWHESYTGIVSDKTLSVITVEWCIEMWRWTFTTPSTVLVVEVAGEVVGFCSFGSSRDEGFDLELYTIYLPRAYQKQGLGRKMWQAVVAEAHSQAGKTLLVWVFAQNPSRKFYEHVGCRFVGSRQESLFGEMIEESAYCFDLSGVF